MQKVQSLRGAGALKQCVEEVAGLLLGQDGGTDKPLGSSTAPQWHGRRDLVQPMAEWPALRALEATEALPAERDSCNRLCVNLR
jgi:hypothetical protein